MSTKATILLTIDIKVSLNDFYSLSLFPAFLVSFYEMRREFISIVNPYSDKAAGAASIPSDGTVEGGRGQDMLDPANKQFINYFVRSTFRVK